MIPQVEAATNVSPEPIAGDDPGDEVTAANQPVTIIEARSSRTLINFRELWKYRELMYFLMLRDIKVRYKQTALGAAWAIIQPFMMMIVFTVFLGRMARVPAGDVPYPLFVYAGLLPWSFFATAISNSGNSVVGSERLITKIYFPRLAIPFAAVGAAIVDFCIAFCMLLAMMAYYRITPGWGILLVPLLLVILVFTALGIGTLLAALNVSYRDFRYVIPFMVQLWMFATPTVYMKVSEHDHEGEHVVASAGKDAETQVASSGTHSKVDPSHSANVPEFVKDLLRLNPLTGTIGFFRTAVLGGALPWHSMRYSIASAVGLFLIGCIYFRRAEGSFADII